MPQAAIDDIKLLRRDPGQYYRNMMAQELPSCALKHLEPGLSGNKERVGDLICATPNRARGVVAVAAYYLQVPNPGYREIMSNVWNQDPGWLLQTVLRFVTFDRCKAQQFIREMFVQAEFEVPFTGSRTVYRGFAGPQQFAATGLAWTLSRDVACWFAFRFALIQGSKPNNALILTATVRDRDVVFYSDAQSQQEIVTRTQPTGIVRDADPTTWQEAAHRYDRRLRTGKLLRSKLAPLSGAQ